MRLIEELRTLLFNEVDETPSRPAQPAVRRAPTPEEQKARRLKALAVAARSRNEPVTAGQIRLQIKTDADLSGHTEILTEEISRVLGAEDVCLEGDPAAPTICFGDGDKDAAHAKLAQVAAAVRRRLGVTDSRAIRLEHGLAEVPPESLEGQGGDAGATLREAIEAISARFEAEGDVQEEDLPKGGATYFLPVWHVQSRITGINRCFLAKIPPAHVLAQFSELLDAEGDTGPAAASDCITLARALEASRRVAISDPESSILARVKLSTLINPASREAYLALLARGSDQVILEIDVLEEGATPAGLGAARAHLGAMAERVSVLLPPTEPAHAWLAQPGLWGATAQLNLLTRKQTMQCASALRQFVRHTKVAGVMSLAHGVNSVGLATTAMAAGFDHLDGAAIHLNATSPRGSIRLNPQPLEASRDKGAPTARPTDAAAVASGAAR